MTGVGLRAGVVLSAPIAVINAARLPGAAVL